MEPALNFEQIKLLVLDVDGVLTDGKIIYSSDGSDLKAFDVQDGLGISLLVQAGIKVAFMSAKGSDTIRRRARDCKVEIILENVEHKGVALRKLAEDLRINLSEVAFVGDDLVDIRAMKICGFPIAVANACPEVKEVAVYVTQREGGNGAVREICEVILKKRGDWVGILDQFLH